MLLFAMSINEKRSFDGAKCMLSGPVGAETWSVFHVSDFTEDRRHSLKSYRKWQTNWTMKLEGKIFLYQEPSNRLKAKNELLKWNCFNNGGISKILSGEGLSNYQATTVLAGNAAGGSPPGWYRNSNCKWIYIFENEPQFKRFNKFRPKINISNNNF